MSCQRNANYELSSRSQLMRMLSAKFPFMREGVATDDGISAKTRRIRILPIVTVNETAWQR